MRALIGAAIAVLGLGVALWAVVSLGPERFIGRRSTPPQLILGGAYRFVRHPFYAGVVLFLVGIAGAEASWSAAVLLLIVIACICVAVPIEERQLRTQHGEAYRRYQAIVPMLFPLHRRRERSD